MEYSISIKFALHKLSSFYRIFILCRIFSEYTSLLVESILRIFSEAVPEIMWFRISLIHPEWNSHIWKIKKHLNQFFLEHPVENFLCVDTLLNMYKYSVYKVFFWRLDISDSSALYEYVNARKNGEKIGQCDLAYPQCKFSAFNVISGGYLENMVP